MFRTAGVLKYGTKGIELYARFHTFVDSFAGKADLAPIDISKSILQLISIVFDP
jgi:hypothetical protein